MNETKRILEMLFNLQGSVHKAIGEFKSNRETKEKAIENMNEVLKQIVALIGKHFNLTLDEIEVIDKYYKN